MSDIKVMKWWYIQDKYINSESNSDGWYWIDNGKMVRISGNVIIQEVKGLSLDEVKKEYNLQ